MPYQLKKGLEFKERKRNKNVRDKKDLGLREQRGKERSERELRLLIVNKSRNLIKTM